MSRLFSAKCEIEWVFLVRGFPLTPNPSPQKFGVSLIKLGSVFVRIYGERGAITEQRDSEVSAIGLAAVGAHRSFAPLTISHDSGGRNFFGIDLCSEIECVCCSASAIAPTGLGFSFYWQSRFYHGLIERNGV